MKTSRIGWLDVATRSQVVSLHRAGWLPAEICERLGLYGDAEENAVRRVCDDLKKTKPPMGRRGFLSNVN